MNTLQKSFGKLRNIFLLVVVANLIPLPGLYKNKANN